MCARDFEATIAEAQLGCDKWVGFEVEWVSLRISALSAFK